MIERIARAMADDARFIYERDPERWTDAAIAAVRAMREPDSKMSARLDLALADWVQDIGDNEDVWRVAIDAILSQPQEEKVK